MGLFSRLFSSSPAPAPQPAPTPAPEPEPEPEPELSPLEQRAAEFAEKIGQGLTRKMFYNDTDATIRRRIVDQIEAEVASVADETEREEYRLAIQKAWNARHNVNGQIFEWNRLDKRYYADSSLIVFWHPNREDVRKYHIALSGSRDYILDKVTGKSLNVEFQHLDFLIIVCEDEIRKIYTEIDKRNDSAQMRYSLAAFNVWIEGMRQEHPGNKRYQFKHGRNMNMDLALSLDKEFRTETHFVDLELLQFATEEEAAEVARLRKRHAELCEELAALQKKYCVTNNMVEDIRCEESCGDLYVIDPLTKEERSIYKMMRHKHVHVGSLQRKTVHVRGLHKGKRLR